MSATLEQTDLEIIELLDFESGAQCESKSEELHDQTPAPHPAQWLALCSCGCEGALCDQAKEGTAKRSTSKQDYRCGQCGAQGIVIVNYHRIGKGKP